MSFFLFTAAAPAGSFESRVRHVIDGDTVVLESGEHVRLIGINAPEYTPWKNHIEPYGKEAALYLKRLVEGRAVRLESDVEKKDRYRRSLAYLWLEDGRMVNALLVRDGMARARYYRPNGAHRAELESEQREAAAAGRGLWTDAEKRQPDPAVSAEV